MNVYTYYFFFEVDFNLLLIKVFFLLDWKEEERDVCNCNVQSGPALVYKKTDYMISFYSKRSRSILRYYIILRGRKCNT